MGFGISRLVEWLTSAVQWNDVVDVHILDRRYRVAQIVFLIGCEVEAPDDGTWLERLAKLAASNTTTHKTAHYEHGWKLEAA